MKYVYLLFLLASFVLSACNTNSPDNPNNPTPSPANLTASVVKNYTVAVSWAAQTGTATLERKTADGEFESLGDVTGKTTFEDFPVFDDMTYTYRLKAGSQTSEASVKVPAVKPNPLAVTLTPDTAHSVTQTIGSSGGSISATGADGVIYTLTIPPDALLRDTAITLTPIGHIGNLPLSGGLLGAVQIEPEDLPLYNYATLTIAATPAIPTGLRAVGFASSSSGEEFHLIPLAESIASLSAQQDDDELAPIRPIRGGTYGAGSGSAEDVKRQIQDHPPTDQTAQTQQLGAIEDDELAPIVKITPSRHASSWGARLTLKELGRPSGETLAVFREYRQWLEYLRRHNLERAFDAQIKAHSRRQATRISTRFDELYQQCEAGDRRVRREMNELLHWSKLYPALVQHLGAAWFSEAEDRVKLCGIPNWEGAASASQPEAIINGYQGSAELRYTVAEVDDEVVSYSVSASNLQFDIASGDNCTVTVTKVEPNDDANLSFLQIDFSTSPATYQAGFVVNVSHTITCGDPPETVHYDDVPFIILFGFTREHLLSNNDRLMSDSVDGGATYTSTWTLNAVPRAP
jgi:hypothetical protein